MIRTRAKKIFWILALLLAACVSFQLGFIWNTGSFSPDIVRVEPAEELDDDRQLQLKIDPSNSSAKPSSFTTTSTSQIYHKTFLITRRSCMQHYDLLIIISSAPVNHKRRKNIRKTWAFERAFRPRWTTVFLVAQSREEGVSNLLLEEDEAHKDLVRANYYDHYWNQTRKIQMGFEWAVRYCNFSFLLKIDDDVFVHIPRVLFFLRATTTPKKKLYAGCHYGNMGPHRKGKWMVTYEEYNETRYPDFCPGFGYILSHDVVTAFVDTFSYLPFFRLDDVYVGMLASKNGISITNHNGFEVWHPSGSVCVPTKDTLVRHDVGEECQLKMFNSTISPE